MERRLPPLLFLGGVACLILGVVTGEGEAGIFIIFPFVVGTGWLMVLGVILIFSSIVAVMFTALSSQETVRMPPGHQNERRTDTKAGGLILIGPVPIVISSDRTLALVLLIVGVAVALGLLVFWMLLPEL